MTKSETATLAARLQKADPIVRRFVAELKVRIEKLHRQIVKLESDIVERDSRAKGMQDEVKRLRKQKPFGLTIITGEPFEKQSREKQIESIFRVAPKLGLKVERIPA